MYLNLIQIAESFGVSESVVEDWVLHDGMPHTTDRGRLLFERAQVVQWAAGRGLVARAGFLTPATPAFATSDQVERLMRAGGIWRDVPPDGVEEVLSKVVAALPGATPAVRRMLTQRLFLPGGITWAPIGGGFALPHPSARIALGRDSGCVAALLLKDGFALAGEAPDDAPVTRMLFFIAPSPRAHLDLLAGLARALSRGGLREALMKAGGDEEIFAAAGGGPVGGGADGPGGRV